MKRIIWILFLLPVFAFADGKPRELPEHSHPHQHSDLQNQIDINATNIVNNGLWIDELDRRLSTQITSNNLRINQIEDSFMALVEQGNTNALNIHNLGLRHDADVDFAKDQLYKLSDRLSASVAASSALDFTAPSAIDTARLNFGVAAYDSEAAFGIGYVRKLKNTNTISFGVATDFGFDETIVKGSFGLTLK